MTAALVVVLCALTAPQKCETIDTGISMPMVACLSPQGQIAAVVWMQTHAETRRLRGYFCSTAQSA
jgi:hypothetical protein